MYAILGPEAVLSAALMCATVQRIITQIEKKTQDKDPGLHSDDGYTPQDKEPESSSRQTQDEIERERLGLTSDPAEMKDRITAGPWYFDSWRENGQEYLDNCDKINNYFTFYPSGRWEFHNICETAVETGSWRLEPVTKDITNFIMQPDKDRAITF